MSSETLRSATRKVSLRQTSDWPAPSFMAMIWPGKRGAKATLPAVLAPYSVMNSDPPDIARFSPAKKPPPVCVSMVMPSVIHAIACVWLTNVSPGDRSIDSVCMTVPEMS